MILDRLKRSHTQPDVKGKRRRPLAFSTGVPAAGIPVTPQSSLSYTAVYSAVSILAGTVASLPLGVFKHIKNKNTEEAFNHRTHPIISTEPNPEMTAPVFWENFVCKMELWGNGFAEIERNKSGQAVALWYIPSDIVTLLRDGKDGKLVYEIRIGDGKTVGLLPRNMFHVPMLGDGLMGLSPISLARNSISAGLAMEQHAGALFGQGAMPGGVLQVVGELDAEGHERLRSTFDAAYKGSAKAGKTVILEEGMEFKPLTMSSDDAQFLETRKFQIDDIARIFRVPPHMLAQMADATFSNIEHQGRSFERFSMRLILCKIAKEINRKMLGFGTQFFAQFDVDDLLTGDSEARSAFNKVMRETGVFSVNDIRRKEGLDTIGDEGDVRIVPMNFTSLEFLKENPGGVNKFDKGGGDVEPAPKKDKKQPTPRDILYPMARDIAGRLWHKGSTAIARMSKKKSGEPLYTEIHKWFRETFNEDIKKALDAFVVSRSALTGDSLTMFEEATRVFNACWKPMRGVFSETPEQFDSYIRSYGFESPEDIAEVILKGLDDGT